jgi:hypothetical protein
MTAGRDKQDKNAKHASKETADRFRPMSPADHEAPAADRLDESNSTSDSRHRASHPTEVASIASAALAAQTAISAATQGSSVSAAAEALKGVSAAAAAAGVQNSPSWTVAEMLKNVSAAAAAAGVQNSPSRTVAEMLKNVSAAAIGLPEPTLSIQSVIRAAALPFNANTLAALRAVSAGDLTSSSDARFLEGWRDAADSERYFKSVPPDAPVRSETRLLAEEYFSEDEGEITSLAELHVKIDRLVAKNPGLALVWRGHQDARWGLHSKLFRDLSAENGGASKSYPSEEQLVSAEKEVLRTARDEWRMNDMSAVEIFARLQHYGAPTRLIDVSRNPLIAAWFAVEAGPSDDQDGRLIALATGSVPRDPAARVPSLSLSANELSSTGGPIWHSYSSLEERRTAGWGTGGNRLVWIPSAYEERISAQNAGFVLDGIPIISTEVLPYFRRASGERSLTDGDLLASGSIFAHTQKPTRKAKRVGPGFAPTFTFRIPKEVKSELRANLASRYSLTRGTLFPDVAGLARYIAVDFGKSRW